MTEMTVTPTHPRSGDGASLAWDYSSQAQPCIMRHLDPSSGSLPFVTPATCWLVFRIADPLRRYNDQGSDGVRSGGPRTFRLWLRLRTRATFLSARESASLPPVDAGSTRPASPSSTTGSASSSERHCRRGVPQHGHRKNVFGRSGRGRIRSTRSVSRCSDCHRPAGRWSAGCNLDPPTGCPTG